MKTVYIVFWCAEGEENVSAIFNNKEDADIYACKMKAEDGPKFTYLVEEWYVR